MVFDPKKIKKRRLLPEHLPEGATREEHILALANQLEERGLASSFAAAKRLAEGMVETERKVIHQGHPGEENFTDERAEFQRNDSPLFRAVGGRQRLNVSESFQNFVERASKIERSETPVPVEPVLPVKEPTKESIVLYEDSPPEESLRGLEKSDRDRSVSPVESAGEQWKVPEHPGDPGYTKTAVEASDDGVVVRHVDATATEDVVVEQGFVKETESEESSENKRDLAKEQGIDLFDIFKTD